jgi:hypothetical protein
MWHHWKKPEKKRRSLIRLGVEQGQAYAWSRSRIACPDAIGRRLGNCTKPSR